MVKYDCSFVNSLKDDDNDDGGAVAVGCWERLRSRGYFLYIRVGGRYYQGFLRMVLVLTLGDSNGIGLPLELQKVSTEAG